MHPTSSRHPPGSFEMECRASYSTSNCPYGRRHVAVFELSPIIFDDSPYSEPSSYFIVSVVCIKAAESARCFLTIWMRTIFASVPLEAPLIQVLFHLFRLFTLFQGRKYSALRTSTHTDEIRAAPSPQNLKEQRTLGNVCLSRLHRASSEL